MKRSAVPKSAPVNDAPLRPAPSGSLLVTSSRTIAGDGSQRSPAAAWKATSTMRRSGGQSKVGVAVTLRVGATVSRTSTVTTAGNDSSLPLPTSAVIVEIPDGGATVCLGPSDVPQCAV